MKIVLYGHPVLRKKSLEVKDIDESLREKLEEMIKIMRKANGIGLAANQVEISERFFVLEVDGSVKRIINPEILEFGEEIVEYEEGCLSIPMIYKKVSRPDTIKVRYQNERGEHERTARRPHDRHDCFEIHARRTDKDGYNIISYICPEAYV